jgi:hypothetical protein
MKPDGEVESDKPSVLEVVLRDWTHRFGPEAAKHRVAYYRWTFRAWLSALIGFAFILVGGISDILALLVIGAVAFCGWVAMSAKAVMELRRMNDSISDALGINKFGFFSSPPSRMNKYRAWCERRDVSPYPFRDVDPPKIRTRWLLR